MSRPSVPSDWPGNQPSEMPTAQSDDVSKTSGLASGLCIAFVLTIAFTIYVLRRRIFPFGPNRIGQVGRRSETLTLEALALIPTHTHKSPDDTKMVSVVSNSSESNDKCCSVCTEPFMDGAELRRLPCGHQFDRACIDPWLCKRSATCPLCREKVTTRPLKLYEKLPMSPRPTFFPPSRWKTDRHGSRGTSDLPALTSTPSVRSPRRDTSWMGRQNATSQPPTALASISEASLKETREVVENRV